MADTDTQAETQTTAAAETNGKRDDQLAVAREYFDAIAAKDLDRGVSLWIDDGVDRLVGLAELHGPAEIKAYFESLFNAFPDFEFKVVDQFGEGDRLTTRWEATGTFAGPGSFQGFEPTGGRLNLEGVDITEVRDGKVAANHAYLNGAQMAQQLGALPPTGSKQEQRMTALFNARTRMTQRMSAREPERIAEGVWLIRGGFPMKTMNVYLIEDGGEITVFDAGIRAMSSAIGTAGVRMGGIKQVLLGHAHADHRGAAPGLDVPVLCHEADKADAEGDGGEHYFDFTQLNPLAKRLMPRMLEGWDGGPVKIDRTVAEGDEIAGFKVIHLPGHSPGMIGIWRESDRLALTSDCFYTLDPQTGRKGHARVPHSAFNQDTEQARASIRKLAEMEPATAWPGHAEPITGDVRSQLEQAAATT